MIDTRKFSSSAPVTILLLFTLITTSCGTLNLEIIQPTGSSTATVLQTSDAGIDHQETTPTQTSGRTDQRTATSEPTSMPEGPSDPYAGLAYGTQEGIFLLDLDGKPKLLLENPDIGPFIDAALSPDGSRVIYAGPGDVKDLCLANLSAGEKRNLTNTSDRTEFSPQWWPARPRVVVFESKQAEDYPFYSGNPTVINLDGSDYRVLDAFTGGPVALSPNGQALAFGCCESQGVIYDWSRGATALDPYTFNVSIQKLFNPAWSPDGKLLAWVVGGNLTAQDTWQNGVAIFDIGAHTVRFLHVFAPLGGTEPQMDLTWSPDGQWLAFVNQNETQEQGRERYLWVIRADGEEEYNLGNGYNPMWSPDGRYLAFNHSSDTPPVELISVVPYSRWNEPAQLPYRGEIIGWITR
jgi:Tol biopolymer transport system component